MSGPDRMADGTAPTNRTVDETLAANERPEAGADDRMRGSTIGRYVVLGRVGAGAMGVVYAAYDPDLDRKVAVKLLQSSDASDTGHRRLLREAQAMAQLNHPHVVTVHDVGEHEGRVFVAMEFVQGTTLREWMRQQRAWPEVLDVFVAAGRGLQAAHQEGLVHRDFKPDNVMLGDEGRVRVMDFGLARPGSLESARASTAESRLSTSHRALDLALTEQGSLVGTPAYMSPEQIAHEGTGPLSDQFAFCVGFWEALYGKRPFPGDTFAVLAATVLDGHIDAPPPGAPVPRWLRRVVQRGLARDPQERWPSMAALLEALTRDRARAQRRVGLAALGGLAAVGGVAMIWQQAEERQHVAECKAEGASIESVWNDDTRDSLRNALLATGMPFAATTADRVTPWLDAQAKAWAEARTTACMHAHVDETAGWNDDVLDRAGWCLDDRRFELESLVATLAEGEPGSVARAIGAAAALRPVAPCLDRDLLLRLPAPPEGEGAAAVRAQLSRAETLRDTGRLEDGLALAEEAVRSADAIAWPPLQALAHQRLGGLLQEAGRFGDAEETLTKAYFEAAHAGATDVAVQAADDLAYLIGYRLARATEGRTWIKHAEVQLATLPDPAEITRAELLRSRGAIAWTAGDFKDARASFEGVLAIQERAFAPDHPSIARTLSNIAVVRSQSGEHAEAEALQQRSLAMVESVSGPDHPDTAISLSNLAFIAFTVGDYARAKKLHARALAIREKAYGPDHADVAASLSEIGLSARALGDYDEARRLQERAVEIRTKVLGPDHPETAKAIIHLANVHSDRHEWARATALYEQALASQEKMLGPEHPSLAGNLLNLAHVRTEAGHHAEAKVLCERAIAIVKKSVGEEHHEFASALHTLGDVQTGMRDYEAARASYERAIAIAERALAPDHPDVGASLTNLGAVHLYAGDYVKAEESYQRAFDLLEKRLGPSHPDLLPASLGLARAKLLQGAVAEAMPLAERALQLADDHVLALDARVHGRLGLADTMWQAGQDRARAIALAEEARELSREAGGELLAATETWLAAHPR